MPFEAAAKGSKVVPTGKSYGVYKIPFASSANLLFTVTEPKKNHVATATGTYMETSGVKYLQIQFPENVDEDKLAWCKWGEVKLVVPVLKSEGAKTVANTGLNLLKLIPGIGPVVTAAEVGIKTTTAVKSYSDNKTKEAQDLMNELLKSDQVLFHRLLNIYARKEKLNAAGVKTDKEDLQIEILSEQYNARQEWIRKNGTGVKAGYRESFKALAQKFSSMIGISGEMQGIGAPPLLIICAVVAVVSIGATVALIAALRPKYDESKKSLVVSDDLDAALTAYEKTNPGSRAKIEENLEEQIDDAFNAGKKDQWWETNGKYIKTAGWVIVGVVAAVKLPDLLQGKKQNGRVQ